MREIKISIISGATYPVNVYISDTNGNNESLLGTITSGEAPAPPSTFVIYNSQIPPIFNTAPAIMLTMIDSVGCRIMKIIECSSGCDFDIIIEPA